MLNRKKEKHRKHLGEFKKRRLLDKRQAQIPEEAEKKDK